MNRRESIVFGRTYGELRVFVASELHSGTFAREREAVAEAVAETGFHRPWRWEQDGDGGTVSAQEVCVPIAKTSDVLVVVLGEQLRPVTRQEYYAAKSERATLIILTPVDCAHDDEVRSFLDGESGTATHKTYTSIADLRTLVLSVLRKAAVRSQREDQAAQPALETGAPERSEPRAGFGAFL